MSLVVSFLLVKSSLLTMNPYFSWPEVRRGKTRFNFFLLSSLNKITSRKASLTLQTFPTILTLKENIAPHSTQKKKCEDAQSIRQFKWNIANINRVLQIYELFSKITEEVDKQWLCKPLKWRAAQRPKARRGVKGAGVGRKTLVTHPAISPSLS